MAVTSTNSFAGSPQCDGYEPPEYTYQENGFRDSSLSHWMMGGASGFVAAYQVSPDVRVDALKGIDGFGKREDAPPAELR